MNKIIILHICFLTACGESKNKPVSFEKISKQTIGVSQYKKIYKEASDSLLNWVNNDLYKSKQYNYTYQIDSLLCFNNNKDRFISAKLEFFGVQNKYFSDGIDYFLGEKIEGKWYFWTGSSYVIPREMVKGHDITKPLSYKQLHKIALIEIYGGYLTKEGKINEKWFTHHFESSFDFNEQTQKEDWFLKGNRFTDRTKYYHYIHMLSVNGLWATRDTTKPKIELPKSVL
jgi:hypothetical protein